MKTYSLPFYDSSKNNLLYCSYVEGLTFPPHFHEQVEILYVLEGEIEITAGDETVLLKGKELVVIFPHKIHAFHTPVHSKVHLIIFPPQLFSDFYPFFHEKQPLIPYIRKEAVPQQITYSIKSLFEYISTLNISFDQRRYDYTFQNNKEIWLAKGYLQILLSKMFDIMEFTDIENAAEDNSVLKCIRFVTDNYQNPIQLADISNHVGISRVQVSRIFTGKIGYSFPEYLYTLRLNHAAHLLQTTDRDILDICNEAGFEAISTFYYYFNKKYHISPKEFRKLY